MNWGSLKAEKLLLNMQDDAGAKKKHQNKVIAAKANIEVHEAKNEA